MNKLLFLGVLGEHHLFGDLLPAPESDPPAPSPPLFLCFCPQPLASSTIVKSICQILLASGKGEK